MSSGDIAPSSKKGKKRRDKSGLWGLIGALLGGLIAGVSTYMATVHAGMTQREQFFHEQRLSAYEKYLTASQRSEVAMDDLLKALPELVENRSSTTPVREFNNFQTSYWAFVDAGWSMELFAGDDLQKVVHDMNAELQERHDMLVRQYPAPVGKEVRALEQRMLVGGEADKMFDLRTRFTQQARADITPPTPPLPW